MKIKLNNEGVNKVFKKGVGFSFKLAKEIADEARGIVPVQTGQLKASIGVVSEKDGSIVEADAPYAARIEANSPFLEPAFDRVLNKYRK